MTLPPAPLSASLAFGLSVLLLTFVQCGNGRVAPQDPVPVLPAPRDEVRLLISGSMQGHLEPCGCASGQLGGLARRLQHIGEQRNYDLLLEGGDLVDGATELDVQKFFTTTQVLFGEHPYDALGVGPQDLLLPRPEWSAFLAGAPVLTTNLTCADPEWPGKPFVEKAVRGMTVRVASLLLQLPAELDRPDAAVQHSDPAAAWAKAFADAAPATLRVLLAHGDDTGLRALIPALSPAPDLVVGIDRDYIEPSSAPQNIGGVPLLFAGIRGRVLLDVRLSRETAAPRATCELVPLAASKTLPGGGGDPTVKDMLLQHRLQVAKDAIREHLARQLPTPNGAAYVGNAQCRVCHETAFASWQKSKHAIAWQTLVEAEKDPKRYGWPVTHYPDCVGCHTVGYRQQTGFVSPEVTPELLDVGCENCHGPGSVHVDLGGESKLGLIGGVSPSMLCVQCHDFEQSPTFLYSDFWPKIEHGREPDQRK